MINRAATSPLVRYTLLGLALLALAGIVWSLYGVFAAQAQVSSQNALQLAAQRYVSSLKDVETAYRGYLIAGTEDFLEPYQQAKSALDDHAAALKAVEVPSGLIAEAISDMITEGQTLLAFANGVIEARQKSFTDAQALMIARIGKYSMDKVRKDLNAIESWSRSESQRNSDQTRQYFPITIAAVAVLALVITLFVSFASRARRASMHARSLLADVIERAPVGLALLDQHLQIHQANNAFAKMAAENGKLRAGSRLASVAPQIDKSLRQRISSAIAIRRRFEDTEAEKLIDVLIDDKQLYFKASVFPATLVDDTGAESPGVGIVLNDMTRQRQSELELELARDAAESANRAKSTFIANMSHELRTPLTAVLGYCELIEEDLSDLGQESILTDVNKINSNARHLLGLINDVLDLSKIEAQKMDVHAVEFTVGAMLEELEAATGSLIAKNNNTLSLTADALDTVLVTDDLKVKQILLNLIGNAAKFTTDGQIAVHATQVEKNNVAHTQFTVKDTGIGMSKEQVANLFQRFTQADETTTRKYGGTGLGLALTRALSKMLGGGIDVESVEGEGTTFTLVIPTRYEARVVHAETGAEVTPAEKGTSSDASKRNIPSVLVVDDDPSARELLTRHLEREGFTVTTASSGAEALEQIKTVKPLAVLLDVMMPGLDGWHVLKAIRANPDTKDIPVIMQTVLDDRNFAYALGATSYLKKPARRDELAKALQLLATPTAGHEVLIVDDDQAANERLIEMLTRDGWNCRMALNGVEALKALTDHQPDLVLIDLIMPEMDGYAFIREVRKNAKFDDLPMVIMTAEDVRSGKVRELASETAGIVQKGSLPLADLVADLRRFADQAKTE
ncbi:MAG: response regulator [Candidatus Competibacteraceae bacterium]|nr:response regulator [Candidatus Competibacteraceae bacterium]